MKTTHITHTVVPCSTRIQQNDKGLCQGYWGYCPDTTEQDNNDYIAYCNHEYKNYLMTIDSTKELQKKAFVRYAKENSDEARDLLFDR